MAIKTFADTSSVSMAYAFSDAADASEVDDLDMNLVAFNSEGFTMSKESRSSTAITDSRRITGSKNTKGTASGSITTEMGANQTTLDMLQAVLMNTWKDGPNGTKVIFDSNEKQYLLWEKTIRTNPGEANVQYLEQFFGSLANTLTMELGDGELITLAMDFMTANADYTEGIQGADGLGGSLAKAKIRPEPYEIADSTNNLENFIIRDDQGVPMELTFASASFSMENNVREQPGLGYVFAAGMGMGKVGVSIEGEAYFYDHTLLDTHMRNKRMSGELSIETKEGRFDFLFPNMTAQSPSASAGGENQDYTVSLTLSAEEGKVGDQDCCVHITFTPAGAVTTEIGTLSAATDAPNYIDWQAAVTGNSVDFSQIQQSQALEDNGVFGIALNLVDAALAPVDLTGKTVMVTLPDNTVETVTSTTSYLFVPSTWAQVGEHEITLAVQPSTNLSAKFSVVSVVFTP